MSANANLPILYYVPGSPPSRAVVLIAKELGLDLEFKKVDFISKEHLQLDYLKLNPLHTVPTLVDDGRPLYDSHAIATYLVGKYGKPNDSLYPQDLYVRAQIDQRLQFETGVIFAALSGLVKSFFFEGGWEIPQKAIASANEGYGYLETFLSGSRYLVGDKLTVADFSVITSVTQLDRLVPIETDKYPLLTQWIKRFDELTYFKDINTPWIDDMMIYIEGIRTINKAAAQEK